MLKLKLEYFGHLMQRADALEKILMLGNTEAKKGAAEDGMVRQHRPLSVHEFEQTLADSKGQGSLECFSPWGLKEQDMTQ